ncbi:hypothetical protein A0U92_04445 [Acetobacter aceti]|uniref:Uncharacterized protein n=1 Tax=Acetobacter aceti TaxID=435 RepID=A0A1U9KEB6_ACEAC|nr:hypothetical protein A0U92_04445 [Acetobacter aceti]
MPFSAIKQEGSSSVFCLQYEISLMLPLYADRSGERERQASDLAAHSVHIRLHTASRFNSEANQ